MKSVSRASMFISLLLSAAACSDKPATPTDPQRSGDLTMLRIAEMGFDTVGAERVGDHIFVEGDISIPLRSIGPSFLLSPASRPLHQYRSTVLRAQDVVYGLTIDLSALGNGYLVDGVRDAMDDWNAAGSGVLLYEDSPGDITVTYNTDYFGGSSCIAAQADFPGFGDTIRFNPNAYSGGCGSSPSAAKYERHMAHELGHYFGFLHTNWEDTTYPFAADDTSGVGAVHVPGTTSSTTNASGDANSVFNKGLGGTAWGGWSINDTIAIRKIYPRVFSIVPNKYVVDLVVGPLAYPSTFAGSITAYSASSAVIPGKVAHFWWSWNPSIATVTNGGLMSAVAAGATKIGALADGQQDSLDVLVADITITGPDSIAVGDSAVFTASISGPATYQFAYWYGGSALCSPYTTCTIPASQVTAGSGYIQAMYRNVATNTLLQKAKFVVVY